MSLVIQTVINPWTVQPIAADPLDPEAYQLAVGQGPCGIWFVIDRVTRVPVALGTSRRAAIADAFSTLQRRADAQGTDIAGLLDRRRAAHLAQSDAIH